MIQSEQIKEKDIILSSFPRSGNTWMRILITDLIMQKFGYNTETEPSIRSDSIIPAIGVNSFEDIDNRFDLGFIIIKTHNKYIDFYKKAICIVRKAEDCLISYYHYQYYGKMKIQSKDPNIFCLKNINNWINHVNSWIEAYKKKNVDAIFITYEDLYRDIFKELNRIKQFLNINSSKNSILKAIKNHEFSKQVNLEKKKKPEKKERFFRKGKIGSGKEELNFKVLMKVRLETMSVYDEVIKIIRNQKAIEKNNRLIRI